MSFRMVELFCDVAACRSFSRAAEVNGISQSSVSQSIAQLEKHLGVSLFNRRKRPLELTTAGNRYFDGCRSLLEQFKALEDNVQKLADVVSGRLRVAAIYSIGLPQMDRLVHCYEERFPDVDLKVEYVHPEDVYDRVHRDVAELGLVSFPKDRGEFAAIPWQEQPFVLVVPPGHRLATTPGAEYASVSIHELQHEDFVNFTSELQVRKSLDRWLRDVKVSPKIIHEFDNVEQIRRAVEDGLGVALLPAATVARSVETRTLVAIEVSDIDWARPLGVIHKRQKTLSNAANRFIELLHDDPESLTENKDASRKDAETVSSAPAQR